jgi:hypothetical protein
MTPDEIEQLAVTLKVCITELRRVAGNIGPMHASWEVIQECEQALDAVEGAGLDVLARARVVVDARGEDRAWPSEEEWVRLCSAIDALAEVLP